MVNICLERLFFLCLTYLLKIRRLDSDYVMIINCGGGVVDVTVHQANEKYISFVSEVHKSSETIYSSQRKRIRTTSISGFLPIMPVRDI